MPLKISLTNASKTEFSNLEGPYSLSLKSFIKSIIINQKKNTTKNENADERTKLPEKKERYVDSTPPQQDSANGI